MSLPYHRILLTVPQMQWEFASASRKYILWSLGDILLDTWLGRSQTLIFRCQLVWYHAAFTVANLAVANAPTTAAVCSLGLVPTDKLCSMSASLATRSRKTCPGSSMENKKGCISLRMSTRAIPDSLCIWLKVRCRCVCISANAGCIQNALVHQQQLKPVISEGWRKLTSCLVAIKC